MSCLSMGNYCGTFYGSLKCPCQETTEIGGFSNRNGHYKPSLFRLKETCRSIRIS